MTTSRALGCALALALLGLAGPSSAAGKVHQHRWGTEGESGSRIYYEYVPAKLGSKPSLIVFLHGCSQRATELMTQSRLNNLADSKRFVVVYPEQNFTPGSSSPLVDGNGIGCWNWFMPEHQTRGAGEPATIAGIARAVRKAHGIDPARVTIAGLSAGGSMATNVAAAYPDVFAAGASIAACAYATCSDVTGVLAHQQMGPRARAVPFFIEQGSADPLNPLPHAFGLASSWLGVADLSDDGTMNGSVPRAPAWVEHRALDQTPSPGSGDACIRNMSWTCPGGVIGFEDRYPHSVARFADASGCALIDLWVLHGLTHAYPSSDPSTTFSDPLGPDISKAMVSFLLSHPRDACARV